MTSENTDLLALTSDIVSAHVSNNSVATSEVSGLIAGVYDALAKLGQPVEEAAPEKPKPAVSIRSSIKPDAIISLIDGKPYRMLKRHLNTQGYTPERYRETFGLPRDYPMIAPDYAEKRRNIAVSNGLGRRPVEEAPVVEAKSARAAKPKSADAAPKATRAPRKPTAAPAAADKE